MFKSIISIASLLVIVSLGLIACGESSTESSSDTTSQSETPATDQNSDAAPAATSAAVLAKSRTSQQEEEGQTRWKGGKVDEAELVPQDFSTQGDNVDVTIKLYDGGSTYTSPPARYAPMDLIFKVGQSMTLTLVWEDPKSTMQHTFTSVNAFQGTEPLGFSFKAKYGKPKTFPPFTFDRAGHWAVHCQSMVAMTGTITVVE